MAVPRNPQAPRSHRAAAHRRREGNADNLHGLGGLDERYYMESKWRRHLRTTHDWKVTTEGLTGRQKKKFLKHKRDSFLNDIRKASARAQADTSSRTLSLAQTNDDIGTGAQGSNEATIELPRNHTRELSRNQQGGPQAQRANGNPMPNLIEEDLVALEKIPWQELSQKQYETLVLARIQQNREQEAKYDNDTRREEKLWELLAAIARKRNLRKAKKFLFEARNPPIRVNTKSAKKRKRMARKAAQREQQPGIREPWSNYWQAVKKFGYYDKPTPKACLWQDPERFADADCD